MQANKGRERLNTGNNPLNTVLLKIWHLPDSFNWMEPLPYAHRRGVLMAALLILCAFLWPNEKNGDIEIGHSSTPVDLSTPSTAQTSSPPQDNAEMERANRILNQQPETPAPIEEPAPQIAQTQATPQIAPQPEPSPIEQPAAPQADNEQWQEFTIQKGHTLTQLFRDNHFIVSDAFLLAQVEGSGKPVNALRIGQKIRVKLTSDKQVTALEVELSANKSALFTRQSNGRFRRDH
ncbi:LysM-like peptidoglycan-binding domain-containing protein [Pragia fontium]|nr:LysM-like peptidoglycan-binding domain-containing protein [Pragia fontium]